MKKLTITLLFISFCAVSAFSQETGTDNSSTEKPVKMAFTGFTSKSIPASGLEILSELVKQEIVKAPEYILVDRELQDTLLTEQEFQLSDVADSDQAVELGEMLGAQQIITGKIGILGKLYIISLKIIDVETGEVLKSSDHEYVGNLEDIRKPVRIATQKTLGIKGIEIEQGNFVNVTTNPPGVRVYIDGLFEGNSPVKVKLEKAGKHYVRLEAAEYASWTNKIEIEENSTYFINATLLKQDKVVDEKVRALQDGRIPLILYTSIFSGVASDLLMYSFGVDSNEYLRLYIGVPIVVAPLAFVGTLKLTEAEIMNPGRAIMIISTSLWGSSWGFTSAFAFGLSSAAEEDPDFSLRPYAGLSVAGGLLYGGIATLITRGEPFPSTRAWLFNAGSVLGSLFGLGVPFILNIENPPIIYGSMLSGSLLGSGVALYLTRDFTVGTNVENIAYGGILNMEKSVLCAGIPSIEVGKNGAASLHKKRKTTFNLGLLSIRY